MVQYCPSNQIKKEKEKAKSKEKWEGDEERERGKYHLSQEASPGLLNVRPSWIDSSGRGQCSNL